MTCQKTNIPQVDNTALECESFTDSKCVLVDKSYQGFGTGPIQLEALLDAIHAKYLGQAQLIESLRLRIEQLENV